MCIHFIRSEKHVRNLLRYGNHDLDEAILAGFTFGGQKENADERFEQFFHDAGMTLLDDEVRLIENHFYLVGRKDPARCKKLISEKERLTPNQLTQHLDKSKPILIIDHQPKELSLLADAGADLILGGHTHNGQLFPGNLLLPLMWENPYGLLKKGNAYSVVTSGAVYGTEYASWNKSEICLVKSSSILEQFLFKINFHRFYMVIVKSFHSCHIFYFRYGHFYLLVLKL